MWKRPVHFYLNLIQRVLKRQVLDCKRCSKNTMIRIMDIRNFPAFSLACRPIRKFIIWTFVNVGALANDLFQLWNMWLWESFTLGNSFDYFTGYESQSKYFTLWRRQSMLSSCSKRSYEYKRYSDELLWWLCTRMFSVSVFDQSELCLSAATLFNEWYKKIRRRIIDSIT